MERAESLEVSRVTLGTWAIGGCAQERGGAYQ